MHRDEKIKEEAKKIMDTFFDSLQKASVDTDTFGVKRQVQRRVEGESVQNPEFKERLLKNAPNKNQDYIVAEKKHW